MIWAALLLGLGGSLHCASMCGPLVFSIQGVYGKKSAGWGFIMYHGGRIIAYLLLAVLFGFIGLPARLFGFQQYISIISGLLLLILVFKDKISITRKFFDKISAVLSKNMQGAIRFKASMPVLGFLNGLLPCGLSYAAAAMSISQGSTTDAIIFMSFFGLGTLPMFLIANIAGSRMNGRWRWSVNRYMKYALTLTALLLVVRGAGLGIPYLSPKMKVQDNKCEMHCCHDAAPGKRP
ncbi:MAG: hypothetical protein GC181_12320 [Bacteroidetes bacterium]|nr:hypothetical protein [Bacteroidota bacterium]